MTITSFQVQNILRTYAKQLSRGQRLARRRMASEPQPADQVNISIEARRKQVIEKITAEIVSNIGYRAPGLGGGPGGLEDSALKRLSQEYGRSLDIGQDENTGLLRFMVREPETGEVLQVLGQEESADLQERLFVITQQIVDENMV
ncbi:MAG: DVU0524 family FlgM-associated protein [Thermodesulfobacteriota bacterium]